MNLFAWLRAQWDRVGAGGAAVAGALLLYFGWRGVADAALTPQQIPYVVSGGLGGIFLVAIASTLWISADLRDEWRKLDVMHDELRQQRATTNHAAAADESESLGSAPPGRRLVRAQ